MGYCNPSDLYDYGLPRGGVPNPGRLIASVSAASNAFELDVHGFENGDPVVLRAEAGGSLPAPLVEGTTYYAVPLTESTFSLSLTDGGSAVDLTSSGLNVIVVAPLPIAKAIDFASALIDDMIPAHAVPLTAPYPPIVVMTCAELAAAKLSGRAGGASVSLASAADAARKRLERWGKGIPIRGTNTEAQKSTLVSQYTAPVATFQDPTGYTRYGGTGGAGGGCC